MARKYNIQVSIVSSEQKLLLHLSDIVREEDPEILLGWNNTTAGWGYLLRRGSLLGIDLALGLSRAPMWGNDPRSQIPGHQVENSAQGSAALGQQNWLIWITGRMTLQLWSIVKKNASPKLKRYSLENVCQHVLKETMHQRTRKRLSTDYRDLMKQQRTGNDDQQRDDQQRDDQQQDNQQHAFGGRKWDTMAYVLQRVATTLKIFYQQDVLGTTSEMSRLIGIDFVSVLRRGSQFRVESVMMRITKPRNYILFNPTPYNIKNQRALEVQALTREPVSGFYKDPVIILDFQSLYPSLMIAYNICYSTIVGLLKVMDHTGTMHNKMGVRENWLERSLDLSEMIRLYDENKLFVAPSGAVFVTCEERKGVLPAMLRELLNTRVMIKKEMKSEHANSPLQKRLQRILNARQFAIKMTSNVTYGYCSASYSGRMPNSGIADAIVSLGRQSLLRGVALLESEEGHSMWRKKVHELREIEIKNGNKVGNESVRCENVYGDTDSMFVRLHHVMNRNVAHDLGVYIAEVVTSKNPPPVKLKYEKCYHPCILQTKKRYVGNMYERKNESRPKIDAKGIETIRIDQCSLTQKLMEKSLRLLFEPPHDIKRVQRFVQRQWRKIEQGRVPVQDFIFCKETRLASGEYRSTGPPAAVVARKISIQNPGAKPLFKERVPYLIAHAHADNNFGSRLIEKAVSPDQFIHDLTFKINEPYYLRHTMQSLKRLFGICGTGLGFSNRNTNNCHVAFDVELWLKNRQKTMNRSARVRIAARFLRSGGGSNGSTSTGQHRTITQYFASNMCRLCGDSISNQMSMMCALCASRPQQSMYQLERHAHSTSLRYLKTLKVCEACSGCMQTPGGNQGVPIQCVSTDCNVYYARHSAREKRLEARHQVDAALAYFNPVGGENEK